VSNAWLILTLANRLFQLPLSVIECLPTRGVFMLVVADIHLTNTRVKLIVPPVAFAVMELLADIMIMVGTVFYLHKGRRGHSSSFRYVAVCLGCWTQIHGTAFQVEPSDFKAHHVRGENRYAPRPMPSCVVLTVLLGALGIPLKYVTRAQC
jgi:hypothetical protein